MRPRGQGSYMSLGTLVCALRLLCMYFVHPCTGALGSCARLLEAPPSLIREPPPLTHARPEALLCALRLLYEPWSSCMHLGALVCTLELLYAPWSSCMRPRTPMHVPLSLSNPYAPPLICVCLPWAHPHPWVPWGSYMSPRALICTLGLLWAPPHPCGPPLSMHASRLFYAPQGSWYVMGLLCMPTPPLHASSYLYVPPPHPYVPLVTYARLVRFVRAFLDICTPSWNCACLFGSVHAPLGFLSQLLKHELAIVAVAWQPPWT
jgi:hypothetical protein